MKQVGVVHAGEGCEVQQYVKENFDFYLKRIEKKLEKKLVVPGSFLAQKKGRGIAAKFLGRHHSFEGSVHSHGHDS